MTTVNPSCKYGAGTIVPIGATFYTEIASSCITRIRNRNT